MDDALRKFEKRHKAITRKHEQLARGYVTRLGKNGVIEHRPMRHLPRVSFSSILIFAGAFIGFKTLLLLRLGETEYLSHVATLAHGGGVERIGAWLMQIDPLTSWSVAQAALIFG